MSAVNTRPLAVGVTPASIGDAAWYFHRTDPLSASTAVTHPLALLTESNISACGVAAASQVAPGAGIGASAGSIMSDTHQSTAPAYNVLLRGSYAAPFHSVPPMMPGQNRT